MLTHTSPCPPPAAGAVAGAAVSVLMELVVVAGAAEGEAPTELLGLKKSARVFFAGDGDGVTVGETAAVVLPFRVRFALDEAVGDSAIEGDAAFSAGEAVAAAFLDTRCFFANEGDSVGDPLGVGD